MFCLAFRRLSIRNIPLESTCVGCHTNSTTKMADFLSSPFSPSGCVDLLIFPWFAATSQVDGHLVLPIYPAAVMG